MTERVHLAAATKDEWLALGPDVGGFEWRIGPAVAFCRTYRPRLGVKPRHQSKQWYAAQIGWWINVVRAQLRRKTLTRAEHEAVVIAALEIGYLYGTAWMRFNLGTVAQTGIKRHQSRRAAGIKSGQARRRTRERTVARIRVEAKKIRSAYPYDRSTHSTRWLAKTIQHRLGLRAAEVEAVRQSLRAAGLK